MEEYRHYRTEHGSITCFIKLCVDRQTVAMGVAFCSPRDRYNKNKGRIIAKGRCLMGLEQIRACKVGYALMKILYSDEQLHDDYIKYMLGFVNGPRWFCRNRDKFIGCIEGDRGKLFTAKIASAEYDCRQFVDRDFLTGVQVDFYQSCCYCFGGGGNKCARCASYRPKV